MDLHAKTNLSRSSIFDSLSQFIDDDPETMRPMFDRIVCRDVPDAEFSPAGIVLTAAPSLGGLGKNGRIRLADVVAVGKGDQYHAWQSKGRIASRSYRQRAEMLVRVGDRVVLDRRKEAEFLIDGQVYTICSEWQAVYGRMRCDETMPSHGEYFECLYDRITVEPLEPEQSGLIARPGTAKQEPLRQGVVRAVGQGSREMDGKIHPLSVKPGDRVLYRAEGGGGAARAEDIQLFGEGLLIMREKLIWAIL